ncbi:MAG: metabolite traffic protein EboE [Bacteroidia bacterium]|nr:metabolite traffic protein EboE [Bacteroidia bacterium]
MWVDQQYHLSYCTNIHPGNDWVETLAHLKENLPIIKARLSPENPFGIGLRLSNKASVELSAQRLAEFKEWLQTEGLYVFTINGFPYGNFHGEKVKEQVHHPDWTSKERLEYTQRLAVQLAELLAEKQEGGISTSPIGYRHLYKGENRKEALAMGSTHLASLAVFLHHLEKETGKLIHIDIEPEPDGLLENSEEFLAFYGDYLKPAAENEFGKTLDMPASEAEELLKRYITLCYDVCHFSLAYEQPDAVFSKIEKAGIRIGKIQISAALKAHSGGSDDQEIWEALSKFDEPVYLHQVTESRYGQVFTYSDLPELLKIQPRFTELRAHFHVPIFLDTFGVLQSTQEDIIQVLDYLKRNPVSTHLEVETYTWDVLPAHLKEPMADSISRELEWVLQKLGADE